MDDTDELRAKSRAPNSGAEPVPEVATNKESRIREEGELSSSENDDHGDDDENHGVCTAASTGMVIHPKVPVSLSLEKRSNPRIKDGEAVYDFSTLSSLNVQSQMSIQPAFKEKFDKNQFFPATTSGLGPSFNANSNLVISFSDNDSGSDNEEHIKEKDSKRQNDFVKNRRPPTLLQAKSHKNSQTFKNASKVIPKKLPLRRSFVSSLTKTGGNNSMAAGPAFLEQGSRPKSFNTLNRSQLNREHGFDQSLSLNDSKLKDLREQIALRENELKLKSVLLNKESIPVMNQNDMNQGDARGLKNSAILEGFMQVEAKEPDKKRLKGSGSYTTQHCSGGPQDLPPLTNKKIVSPSEVLGMDNCHLHNPTDSDHVKKDILMGRSPSKMNKQRKHNHVQLGSLPENIPRLQNGSPISNHLNHSDEGKQVNPCVVVDQPTTITTNTIRKVFS